MSLIDFKVDVWWKAVLIIGIALMAMSLLFEIMLYLGYEEDESLVDIIRDQLNNGLQTHNIIVVLGCQTEIILQNRAYKAAELYERLCKMEIGIPEIIASGLTTPAGETKKILKEHRLLKKYIKKRLSSIRGVKVDTLGAFMAINSETKSHDTISNIMNIFEEHIIPKYRNSNVNIFIVSSNFHLLRIASTVEDIMVKGLKEELFSHNININTLTFVGADDAENDIEVIKNKAYIKSMAYEIYAFFLKNNLFDMKKS